MNKKKIILLLHALFTLSNTSVTLTSAESVQPSAQEEKAANLFFLNRSRQTPWQNRLDTLKRKRDEREQNAGNDLAKRVPTTSWQDRQATLARQQAAYAAARAHQDFMRFANALPPITPLNDKTI